MYKYVISSSLCGRHVNLRKTAGKVFLSDPRKQIKTYILTLIYIKSPLSTIALSCKRWCVYMCACVCVLGGSQSFVLFPLKFITEAPHLTPPHRTDRVPRELHFRHYCQVPLTPFVLPFYLQQLIRVPLPFSLLDVARASPVKPFHFSEEESASILLFPPSPRL